MSSYEVDTIVKNRPIVKYLEGKGIHPARSSGNKFVYRCPLPSHPGDKIPSFYVYDKGNKQDFVCWGCKAGGSIINLVSLMESISIRDAIKSLGGNLSINIDNAISYVLKEIIQEKESTSKENTEEIWSHAMSIAAMTHGFLKKVEMDQKEFFLCERAYEIIDGFIRVNDLKSVVSAERVIPKKLRNRLIAFAKQKKQDEIREIKSAIRNRRDR